MKSTSVKSIVAKVMTVGLLAGAFVLAAPMKAEAQQFSVGVQVGFPHNDYSHRDYFEFQRREAIRRHEELMRRQAWERAHRFHGRDRFGWR